MDKAENKARDNPTRSQLAWLGERCTILCRAWDCCLVVAWQDKSTEVFTRYCITNRLRACILIGQGVVNKGTWNL